MSSVLARADVKTFGIIGHSYGGGTAVSCALNESRIQACVALDSWMYPLSDEDRIPKKCPSPIMFISGDEWRLHSWQVCTFHYNLLNLIINL